jgi:hypothetical protein
VDIVREIMEFYYRRGRGLQVGFQPGGMEALCAGKKKGGGLRQKLYH